MTPHDAEVTPAAFQALLGEPVRVAAAFFALDPPTVIASKSIASAAYDPAAGRFLCNADWLRKLVRSIGDREVCSATLLALAARPLAAHLAREEGETPEEVALHVARVMGFVLAKVGCPREVFDGTLPILVRECRGLGSEFERARLIQEGYDQGVELAREREAKKRKRGKPRTKKRRTDRDRQR